MQNLVSKKSLIKVLLFLFINTTIFAGAAKAGLDYYRIFLGKNLIYERYVNKPLSLQNLPVTQANASETLTIYYYQCQTPNGAGNDRSIILKDDKGNIIKQWHFANTPDANKGMTIQVKELLQLQKANKSSALALFYTAQGRAEGEKLALIQAASKDLTSISPQRIEVAWLFKSIEV